MRIKRLTGYMEEAGLDAYIISKSPNVYYFTGTISGGKLILTRDDPPVLLTSRLNMACAKDQSRGCEVRPCTRHDMLEKMVASLQASDPRKIGFDDISLSLYNDLKEKIPNATLMEAPEIVREMRMIKDSEEIELMRRAGALADSGMEAIRDCIGEGVRENEVAAEAAYAMRKQGADALAFPFIVVSGPRSAYPHGGVTERKIRKGEFVTIDMGASFREYKSDITRTFIVGTPIERQRDIYETVLQTNMAALDLIRKGETGFDVHMVAAKLIEDAGYGEHFIHDLGHGVGLEVHEGPNLGKTSKDTLRKGMVVTDEPGIYIHGFGGVRIEDTVLVTDSAPERLTRYAKDLDAMRV